jgi:ABC-type multidrug transport system ATPase subunit
MYSIETKNLNYQFSSKEQVLQEINLQVPKGSIYGFLGPNGAGKTTTLKLILGLLRKQKGEVEIFNKDFHSNRTETLQKIGSLIESPSLYGHLNAVDNLRIWQKVYGCPKERIDEVLDIVGLSHTGKKKSGKFSLGMKQRLSIAIALLHDPELLILDEPTNGLDPNGILEIRELLEKINKERGITIVISSHLLAEIEKLVNYVGIINHGKIVFQGTMEELQFKQTHNAVVSFDTSDAGRAMEIITKNGSYPTLTKGKVLLANVDRKIIAGLNATLVNEGIEVYQISTVKNDLESIFMDITNTKA